MKIFILLLLTAKINIAFAQEQSNIDSAKQVQYFLAGFWQEDSAQNKIEFIPVGNSIRLLVPDAYTYEFFETNTFPLKGGTISWPPHDCEVKKINEHSIAITFTLFGGSPMLSTYKKVVQ